MSNPGNKPDYHLSAKTKDTAFKGRVGVAWLQADGSIQIKVDPFVILQGEGVLGEKLYVTLYPTDELCKRAGYPTYAERQQQKQGDGAKKPASKYDDLEDDIPF